MTIQQRSTVTYIENPMIIEDLFANTQLVQYSALISQSKLHWMCGTTDEPLYQHIVLNNDDLYELIVVTLQKSLNEIKTIIDPIFIITEELKKCIATFTVI